MLLSPLKKAPSEYILGTWLPARPPPTGTMRLWAAASMCGRAMCTQMGLSACPEDSIIGTRQPYIWRREVNGEREKERRRGSAVIRAAKQSRWQAKRKGSWAQARRMFDLHKILPIKTTLGNVSPTIFLHKDIAHIQKVPENTINT